jgi:hypothetical protein
VFSVFKRGMKSIYQHCNEKYLQRYLAEYDFRDNTREKLGFNKTERTLRAIHGAEGKRLIYRQPHLADYGNAAERFLRWRRKNHKGLKPLEPVRETVELDESVVIAWSVLLLRRRTDVESRDPPHLRPYGPTL